MRLRRPGSGAGWSATGTSCAWRPSRPSCATSTTRPSARLATWWSLTTTGACCSPPSVEQVPAHMLRGAAVQSSPARRRTPSPASVQPGLSLLCWAAGPWLRPATMCRRSLHSRRPLAGTDQPRRRGLWRPRHCRHLLRRSLQAADVQGGPALRAAGRLSSLLQLWSHGLKWACARAGLAECSPAQAEANPAAGADCQLESA